MHHARKGGKTTSVAAKKTQGGWKTASLDSGVRALSDPFSISVEELDGLFGYCASGRSSTGKVSWELFIEKICKGSVSGSTAENDLNQR